MATATQTLARRRFVEAPLLVALAALGLVVLLGRLADLGRFAVADTFVLVFTSIVIEALPFILMGALVSALIEVFVPASAFARLGRLPTALQLPAAAFAGFAFPVCECGSVPVARRLIARGMHPSAGVAFMLAAPVFNPIVLASTFIAYRGRDLATEMVLGRAGLGVLLALLAGWAIGTDSARELLRQVRATSSNEHERGRGHGHAHERGRLRPLVDHLSTDFFFMGKFVVAGAALAAALQTLVPQSLVGGVARTPLLGTLALMAIAFMLSLCSEADAFVAVSFVQFPLGSQLAFLVFGPVVDAKLALLYSGTFRRRFVARLVTVALPVVLAGSLWFEALIA